MKVVATEGFFESLKGCYGIRRTYHEFISWFRHHFRKDFLKLLLEVLKSYPYDSSYLLYLEQAKIREMANYIEKRAFYNGYENDVKWMRIADRLIDIITEKKDLYHYEGNIEFVERDDGYFEMVPTPDHKYICDVNVNVRNAKRFLRPQESLEIYERHKHELYIKKARHLYHMIRLNYEQHWWD